MKKYLLLSLIFHISLGFNFDFLKNSKDHSKDSNVLIELVDLNKDKDSNVDAGKSIKSYEFNVKTQTSDKILDYDDNRFTKGEELSSFDGKSLESKKNKTFIGIGVELDLEKEIYVSISKNERILGYRISKISKDFSAFHAGLQVNDILLKVKNESIKNKIELKNKERVSVLVMRNNNLINFLVLAQEIPYI